jgi:hypothetical protein
MVLVHHFDGVSDHVETLSNKKLPADALNPGSFPKGQYFAVGQKDFQFKKTAEPHSSAKDNELPLLPQSSDDTLSSQTVTRPTCSYPLLCYGSRWVLRVLFGTIKAQKA